MVEINKKFMNNSAEGIKNLNEKMKIHHARSISSILEVQASTDLSARTRSRVEEKSTMRSIVEELEDINKKFVEKNQELLGALV